ncbi:MAG TPA: hypothetical protein ENK00_05520, partial [Chromatiales bacterium]|nr:hypothetical protein [Chromatiales bacterium]
MGSICPTRCGSGCVNSPRGPTPATPPSRRGTSEPVFVPPLDLQGLSEAEFLHDYWQKRPCLIRGGLKGLDLELEPGELAGLACEEGVPARILVETGDEAGWA